jgi:hypothetical protein
MIENDFDNKDTLEQRVEKLNGQTGLGFVLREQGYKGLVYLERAGKSFTGAMRPHLLMHWTGTFALGFRVGHAAAGHRFLRDVVKFWRLRRGSIRKVLSGDSD